MHNLTLSLTLSEFDALEAIAEQELRTPEAQALYMLRQELKCRSLDVPKENDTPVVSSGDEFFTVRVHDEAGNKKTFRVPRGEADEHGWYSVELPPEAFVDSDSVIVEDVNDVLKWQSVRIDDDVFFKSSWLEPQINDTHASTSGHVGNSSEIDTTGKLYNEFLTEVSSGKAYTSGDTITYYASWPNQPAMPHIHNTGEVERATC